MISTGMFVCMPTRLHFLGLLHVCEYVCTPALEESPTSMHEHKFTEVNVPMCLKNT